MPSQRAEQNRTGTHHRPVHILRKRVPNPSLPWHRAHFFMAAFLALGCPAVTRFLSRCGLTALYLATCAQEDFLFPIIPTRRTLSVTNVTSLVFIFDLHLLDNDLHFWTAISLTCALG